MATQNELILAPDNVRLIFSLRIQRVILDQDLAAIYRVPIKRLNEQYRRNLCWFPIDFASQVTADEWASLRSQIATLNSGRGEHRK